MFGITVEHIEQYKMARDISSLNYCLSNNNIEIRFRAAEAIGYLAEYNIGHPSSIPLLNNLLKDKFPGIRKNAAGALWSLAKMRMGLFSSIFPLNDCLSDQDSFVCQFSLLALEQLATISIFDASSIPLINRYLTDSSPNMRINASDALKEINQRLKEKENATQISHQGPSFEAKPETAAHISQNSKEAKKEIKIKTAINYERAHVIYKVKIENESETPIAKIIIKPIVLNDVFIMDRQDEEISLLDINNAQTATFKLRPRGECGDVRITGKITYFDMVKRQSIEKEIPSRMVTIICPLLKVKPISEEEWQENISTLIKIEETTEEVPINGRALMDMLSDTIRDLNFYQLKPIITETESLFRGKMKFYSEGQGGLHYALSLEIIGGHNKSKIIIKNYANTEEALTGCYHKILDEIEKRVKIKQYLTENTIHVHGDYIQGEKKDITIKESVIMRSSIGNDNMVSNSVPKSIPQNENRNIQEMKTHQDDSISQENQKCSKCGKELKPWWNICPYCGIEK